MTIRCIYIIAFCCFIICFSNKETVAQTPPFSNKAKYKFEAKYNTVINNSLLYNLVFSELFNQSDYEVYSSTKETLFIPILDSVLLKKRIDNNIIHADLNLHGATALLFIENGHKVIEYLSNSDCNIYLYKKILWKKTGRIQNVKKFGKCTEWKPIDKKYNGIYVWTSDLIPRTVHPGIFVPDSDGGVFSLIVDNMGSFTLWTLENNNTYNLKLNRGSCRVLNHIYYDYSDTLLQSTKSWNVNNN